MNDNLKKGIISSMINKQELSVPECVNYIQGFCLGLRLTHWETNSFALHKAAEEIQGTLEGLMDTFVEAAVGSNEGKRPVFKDTVTKCIDPDTLVDYLKSLPTRDSTLLNIRDEMVAAVYKFKYLKTLS
ncbi:MAG: DUF5856 family protein [Bacilli bacterium]|jgi:hypothetical protein